MALENRLALLKTDLGFFGELPAELTAYLTALLTFDADLIAREGVTLDPAKAEDDQLAEMYAAWMYRKRASQNAEPPPRMLRYALNLRIAGGAMGRGEEETEAEP